MSWLVRAVARLLPTKGVVILMYHSISTRPTYLAVPPDEFEAHLRYITLRGWRTVFASELPAALAAGEPAVCITLDDGYEDNYTTAFPLLKKYGCKATIFIVTGTLGQSFNASGENFVLMTESQVKDLEASGLAECMPHTHSHVPLKGVERSEVDQELSRSKSAVETLTNKPASVFAYPKSKIDLPAKEAVKAAGFSLAVGGTVGHATSASDMYDLPRIMIYPGDWFELKLTDAFVALKKFWR